MKLMDSITQGVYVIGCKDEGTANLMTAAWLTQISSRPAEVLVAVSSGHLTADILKKHSECVISVLAEDQVEIAKLCGFQSGRKTDKTKAVPCSFDEKGLPSIDGAAAVLQGTVVKCIPEGNHDLFIIEITDGKATDKTPLKYISQVYFG